MKVTYLHLGSDDDAFYGKMVAFMRLAADSLGVQLESIPCFRNAERIRREGASVVARRVKPDYLLLPNHKGLALELVPAATAAGIRVFLVNEGLLVAEKATLGLPREKHPLWLGEIVPDEREYGYSLAEHLVEAARARGPIASDGRIHVAALTGGFNFASISRTAGLRAAATRHADVVLGDTQPAHWEQAKARELTAQILARHPQTAVIWAASDTMALGAIEALAAAGRSPGRDVLVGGVDWAPFVPDQIRAGRLAASAGGHFMDGAWALVMVFDHHHGVDPGAVQVRSQPALLSAATLDEYAVFFREELWSRIDFSRFSRFRRPGLAAYDFSLEAVVRGIAAT